MTADPKRLSELDSGELRASLLAAKRRLPSSERWAELEARLQGAGVFDANPGAELPAAPPPPSPAATPALSRSLGAKHLLTALAVVGLGLAGGVVYGTARPPDVTVTAVTPAAPLEVANHTGSAPPERSHAAARPSTLDAVAPAVVPTPTPAPGPAAVEPALTNSAPPTPSEPEITTDEPAPVTPSKPATPSTPSSPVSSTRATPSGTARAPSGRAAAPVAVAPHLPDATPESELALLKRARSQLSGDPLQALASAERCRSQYPNGAYAQERDFIALSALARLGRTDEARVRARAFRDRYPRSAYMQLVDRLLGAEGKNAQ